MNAFAQQFGDIVGYCNGPCISIYMPTHSVHVDQPHADAILLKNLLAQAKASLARYAPLLSAQEIDRLLQPVADLLEQDGEFWRRQQDGLAIFVGRDFARVWRLPLSFRNRVAVGSRFFVRPLLPLLSQPGNFYLLALSQNQLRFFRTSRTSIERLPLEGVAENLDAFLAREQAEPQLQFRGTGGGGRATVFSSSKDAESHKKETLQAYCRQIDEGVKRYLHGENAPLLLACVGYLEGIYRPINSYPHLQTQFVAGSPDRTTDEALQREAWGQIAPFFEAEHRRRVDQACSLHGQRRAWTAIEEILRAAADRRLHALYIADNARQWGYYDRESATVHLHRYAGAYREDLLNLAAIAAYEQDGHVESCKPGELPLGVKLIGLPRFERQPNRTT